MKRTLIPAMIVFCVLGLTASMTFMFLTAARKGDGTVRPTNLDNRKALQITNPGEYDRGLEGLIFPEFQLVNQEGADTTHALLDDRVTIVDFIFTNCPFVCPGMAMVMGDLSDRLDDTNVRFLSISVDPAHDTPEVLKAYSESISADLERWEFLTGEKDHVYSLIRDGIGFAVEEDDEIKIKLDENTEMSNIRHPSKLVLIGPGREVLAMFSFDNEGAIDLLEARARALDDLNN